MGKRKSRRRENGDGSLYQRADGRWCAALRLGGPGCKPTVRYAPTREEAKLKLDQLRTEKRQGFVPRKSTSLLTVETWLNTLIAECEAPATRALYRNASKKIVPALGHRPLHQLATLEIGDWIRKLDCGSRMKQQAYDLLKHALNTATTERRIDFNPITGVRRPQHKVKPQKPFTIEEVCRIMDAMRGHRIFGIFALIFSVGMRQGEVLGLRWSDIDWEAGLLTVRQGVSRNETGGLILRPPKTTSGVREVPLTDELMRVLLSRALMAQRERLTDCELIFPTKNSRPMSASNLYNGILRRVLSDLGIPHRGLHSGRHSASTFLLRNGVPLHIVSKVLGHSNTSTTSRIYSHVLSGDSAAAIQPLSATIGYTMAVKPTEPNPNGKEKT